MARVALAVALPGGLAGLLAWYVVRRLRVSGGSLLRPTLPVAAQHQATRLFAPPMPDQNQDEPTGENVDPPGDHADKTLEG